MVLVCAASILAAALCLRLFRLGAQELWLDEAFSFFMGTTPHVVGGFLARSTPPLYYLLLRGWIAAAGSSEAALRLLSALSGTLFVAVVIWWGREVVDIRAGLWCGLMAAVSPLHIYYSQEARAYVLLTVMLTLSYVLLWKALMRNTWHWWALLAGTMFLAVFTHYLAVLGLLPAACLVMLWPGPSRWGRYLATVLASCVLLLPWIVWSFLLTSHAWGTGLNWVRGVWEATPHLLALPLSLEVFGLGGQAGLFPIRMKQFSEVALPTSFRLLGVAVLAVLLLWIAIPMGDRRLEVPWLTKRKAWLASLLLAPLGVLWLVSFYRPLYVIGRYDLVAYPSYPLLLGLALAKLQRVKRIGPILAPIMTLLLLLPVGSKLFRYYEAPSTSDAEATAQVLHGSAADGDVVVFTGLRGLRVLYYLDRLGYRWEAGYCRHAETGRRFGCRMYPRETERRPAAVVDTTRVLTSPEAVHADVQDFLKALPPHGGSVLVVFESGSSSQGRLTLPKPDALLLGELQRLDLELSPVKVPLGIFRFRRA